MGFALCAGRTLRFAVRVETTFTTRELGIGDYRAVVALWEASAGVEIAEGDDQESIARYLARNPGLSRVAVMDGRIIGAVLCGHDGRRGLIYHLAVAQEDRGKGIGRRLTEECAQGLKRLGLKRAILLVAKGNEDARGFWRAAGFEPIAGAEPFGVDL